MAQVRLDQLLVTRGLASSRQRARALILAGDVSVAGVPGAKAGTLVDPDANVAVRIPDHPWVGRGGVKLAHALDAFGIDPAGRAALDIGASTGGFTDVLLQRGARQVVALDVGRNQLDWKLRNDPRVRVLEGINARYLRSADLPNDARAFDLVTIDVAFISLKQILPVVPALLAPGAAVIALVKPQFEAGRQDVRKGIVRDPEVHERVIEEVTSAARASGLEREGLEPSPIEGAEGNREFFLCLKLVNNPSVSFTRIGLTARLMLPGALSAMTEAASWLAAHDCRPVLEREAAVTAGLDGQWPTAPLEALASQVDLVIAFGGDGTMLSAAGAVAHAAVDIPVLGVNLGRLGFLTEVTRTELTTALEAVRSGNTRVETRLMLQGRVHREDSNVADHFALNDIVVTRGSLSRMIEIDVTVDDEFVCHVKADGLIVATATGSTAYNLSAGGPIVHPSVDAVLLTPIAPHTLTNRPLVLPATAAIVLRPTDLQSADVVVTFDGQYGVPLEHDDAILIGRAERRLQLLHTGTRTHFTMLREKLKWGNA